MLCLEYKEASQSKKRRALDPSVEVAVNNVTIEQAEADIELDDLQDLFYDFDWEQERDGLQGRYETQFGVDQINLQPNMEFVIFQMQILALTSPDSENAPIQTGWIRAGSTQNTTHATWEDYIMINQFISQNNLSNKSGDELLKLIRELCTRNGIELNLPRTMRSIK